MSQHEEFDELYYRNEEVNTSSSHSLTSIMVLIVIVTCAVLWAMWRLA